MHDSAPWLGLWGFYIDGTGIWWPPARQKDFLKGKRRGGDLSVSHSQHSTSISFLSLSLILTCQISRSFSLTGLPTHNCVFALRVEGGMWAASKQQASKGSCVLLNQSIEWVWPAWKVFARITVCYCKTFLFQQERIKRKGCHCLKPFWRHFYDSVLIESVHLFASLAERSASHVCVCVCNAAIPVIYIVATKGMLTMRPRYMRMAQFLQVLRAHQSPCFSSGTNLWALKYFKR